VAKAAGAENKVKEVKNLTLVAENKRIIAYSLKKINTNPVEAYSILNPETNSDSPSEKSKGVRLVSARSKTNHITLKKGRKIPIVRSTKRCSFTL